MHILNVAALANASQKRACACASHICDCLSLHLSTWTLTPSLINVRGLRQALHVAFCGDGQILGSPVTPGVRVGTTHEASTKTALPFMNQTCAVPSSHHLLCVRPFEERAASGSVDAKGAAPLFLVLRYKSWMFAANHRKDCGPRDDRQASEVLKIY